MKIDEHRGRKSLGEDIGELRRRRYVKDPDVSNGNPLTDEVEVDLNMLRALVLNRVDRQIHGTHIVTIDKSRASQRSMKFLEQLAEP